VLVLVDNCYGEFTEEQEPTAVGAGKHSNAFQKLPARLQDCPPSGGTAFVRAADLVMLSWTAS
jgi:hypothetical protein